MANKILYCATVDYHFKAFHLPYMKWFKEKGWEVDVAASGEINLPFTDHKYNIPITRSPFSRSNINAYKKLKRIIDQNNYSIIHCHTPLGGVLTRLAAQHARKTGTKVIYTAHGFHFCKGASLMNWAIYYPIERHLSRYTDSLITINQEDYNLAIKHRFKANKVELVSGVGVDTEKFKPLNQTEKVERKKSFGYQANDFLLFYAAEFNKNKNQQFLLHSLALIKDDVKNIRLLLAGEGPLLESCRNMAQDLGISHMVDFLGFESHIEKILPICDTAVASSLREGLPVNIMEAMACELPVLAVDNRGHRELIRNNKNGWTLGEKDYIEFSTKIKSLASNPDLKSQFGKHSRQAILQKYSIKKVLSEKVRIYEAYMDEQERIVWQVP